MSNREIKFQVIEADQLLYWQVAFSNIHNSPAYVRKIGKSFAINTHGIVVTGNDEDDGIDGETLALENEPASDAAEFQETDAQDDEEEVGEFEVDEEYVEGEEEYEDYDFESEDQLYGDGDEQYYEEQGDEEQGDGDDNNQSSQNGSTRVPSGPVSMRRVSFVSHFDLLREAAANIRALYREIEIRSDELMDMSELDGGLPEDEIEQQQDALRTLEDNVTVIASNLESLSSAVSDEQLSMYLLRSVVLKTRYLLRVLTELHVDEITTSTDTSVANVSVDLVAASVDQPVRSATRRRSTEFGQMLDIINADVSSMSQVVVENLVVQRAEPSASAGSEDNQSGVDTSLQLIKPSKAKRAASIFVRMPPPEVMVSPVHVVYGNEEWNGELTMVKAGGLAKASVGGVILDLLPDKFDPLDPHRRPNGWNRVKQYRLEAAERLAREQGASSEVIQSTRVHRESEVCYVRMCLITVLID